MKNTFKLIYEYGRNRFVLYSLFLFGIVLINILFDEVIIPRASLDNLWFYSGLAMVLFSILFIEPYYTSPKNVITNTIPLLFGLNEG